MSHPRTSKRIAKEIYVIDSEPASCIIITLQEKDLPMDMGIVSGVNFVAYIGNHLMNSGVWVCWDHP